ncbi:MAG: spore cortex biosynthesis protein YabQ [Clostridium sp.]|nr:spore cortex biosynthesis protein YabQ [Clostridium sp.]
MYEFISGQWNMMLISLLLGVCMGFIYDLIRCFRRLVRHNNFFIALSDLLFWLFGACITIACINRYNYGSLRWYVLFGMLLGFLVYHYTVSWVFLFAADYVIVFIRKIYKKICKKCNVLLKKINKWVKIKPRMSKNR